MKPTGPKLKYTLKVYQLHSFEDTEILCTKTKLQPSAKSLWMASAIHRTYRAGP